MIQIEYFKTALQVVKACLGKPIMAECYGERLNLVDIDQDVRLKKTILAARYR